MKTILLNKPRYSFCKGHLWTKTVGMLALIMILATFKAQAQNQTFCAPATVSNLANPGSTGFTGQWFADASGGTALAPTTALATGIYYAEQNNPQSIATLGSGFRGPTGIAIQADGKILVADFQNNFIRQMNADGSGVIPIGSTFSQPISVAVEADGKILVAEFGTGNIKRMNANGSGTVVIASGFNSPGGITVQSDGKILVANQGGNTIIRIDADGTNRVTLGSGFGNPYSTAVQSDGKILVADASNRVIKRMNADGTNIVTLATGFSSPRRIAIQPDGKILVADFGSSTIKRMNADGTGLITLGTGFSSPFGVTFESTGKIIVADFGGNSINRITEENTTRAAVNVTVNTTPVPTRNMSITGTLCNGATIGTLISKFNTSTNVKCYAAATGGTPLTDTELIAPVNASVTFYLTQTIDGCESERLAYTAVVNFIKPPIAVPNQNFCSGATVADLVATPGTSGTGNASLNGWYTAATGGSRLANTTVLTNGNYYVGQIHISGCTLERTMVTVTINAGNLASPTVPSPQVYAGAATLANLGDFGNNLRYYENATGGSVLPFTTALVDGTTYYVSQSDLCGESLRTAVTVKKISEAAQNLCAPATVANLVSTVSNGTSASWFTAAPGTTVLASTTALSTGTYYVEQTTPENITTLGSGFAQPTGIAIQSDGKIIVADFDNNLVKRMNADGTNLETLGSDFSRPRSVAVEADGKILIMDNDLKRMNTDGTNVVVVATGFNVGRGIAVQPDGKILIADQGANSIIRINPDGTGRTILGSGFRFPLGIAVQSDGTILVADMANRVIKKMNADGTDIVTLATGFGNPSGIAIQADGKILIADQARTSIIRINADGTELVTLGSGLQNPFGVAVDASGKIVVADFNNNAIKRITEESRTNRVAVAVTINEAPTVPSPQIYAGSATLANLGDFGNNLRYYENATGGSVLPFTTALVDGTTYYVSQSDLCGESPRTAVTVKKISEASQNLCTPAIVSDLIVTPSAGSTVNWYGSSKGTAPLASTTPLVAGTYYIAQVAPAFITTLPVSYNTDGGMALQQDDKIVLADYSRIMRINADGSNVETLLSLPSSYIADVAVQQDGKIIFTDSNTGSIKRINADGTNLETVISGLVNPTFIAVQSDDKIIFVADLGIYSVNTNGTGLVLLRGGSASFGGNITDIVIQQDGKILYPVAGNGAVLRMDADGTNNILFYQEQNSFFYGLSVQNDGKIIATDIFNGGRIIRLNADGTNLVTLASNLGSNVFGIQAEPNGNILFTETSTATPLKRINNGVSSNRVSVTVNTTPKTNNVTNISVCGSYYWSVNEQTYTTSGTYTFVNGCATETLNATITPETQQQFNNVECDSYTWPANGQTYTQSGNYTFVDGCITKNLQLTIVPTTINTTPVTACTSYFWRNTGQIYTVSGQYSRTLNCIKEILDLTIVPASENVTTASACTSYTWNGETYTQSGTYTGTTTNCVTEKLVLTIVPGSENVTTASACTSYTWNGQTYTQSGTYTGTTTNCVTEKLVLTINAPIDSSVTLTGDTLTSNATSGSYQWIDCNNANQPIAGETNQAFTPKQPGRYAVIVTQNTCSITSNCQVIAVLGNDTFALEDLRYFPNPTVGLLNIKYSAPMNEIVVMNIIGQTVFTLKPNSNEIQVDMSTLASNTYLIKITSGEKSKLIKVIKN